MLSTDVEVVSGEKTPSVEAFIDGFNICGCSFVGVIKVDPVSCGSIGGRLVDYIVGYINGDISGCSRMYRSRNVGRG